MNSSDKESRKRGNHPRGMANGLTKYSDETVQDVLRWRFEGASINYIVDRRGCSRRWVGRVIDGQIRSQPTSPPSLVAAARAAARARAEELRKKLSGQSVCVLHPDDLLDEEAEEWRPTAYAGYFVSSLGRVCGRQGRVLKLMLKSGAYWVVACGRNNQKAVHTLVCTAVDRIITRLTPARDRTFPQFLTPQMEDSRRRLARSFSVLILLARLLSAVFEYLFSALIPERTAKFTYLPSVMSPSGSAAPRLRRSLPALKDVT